MTLFHLNFVFVLCLQNKLVFYHFQDVVSNQVWQVVPVGLSERQLFIHCHGYTRVCGLFSWESKLPAVGQSKWTQIQGGVELQYSREGVVFEDCLDKTANLHNNMVC